MDHYKNLGSYNKEIVKWDFERERLSEFINLLTDRNRLIYEQTPLIEFIPYSESPSKNEACINLKYLSNLEHIAFHVGVPHQKRLSTLIKKNTGYPNNEGVFFSLEPRDIIYFSNFDENPYLMIYLLDLHFAKDVKVQTDYDKSVISRYDLDDLFKPENPKDKLTLGRAHKILNQEWIKKNTIPFDMDKITDLIQKEYDWLIVPDPIDVNY